MFFFAEYTFCYKFNQTAAAQTLSQKLGLRTAIRFYCKKTFVFLVFCHSIMQLNLMKKMMNKPLKVLSQSANVLHFARTLLQPNVFRSLLNEALFGKLYKPDDLTHPKSSHYTLEIASLGTVMTAIV